MTLHEAIVDVLRARRRRLDGPRRDRRGDRPPRPLPPAERRAHPPSDQIRLRARKPDYQHLFECSDTACSRIRLRSGSTRARSASRSRRAGAAGRTGKAEAKARSLRREPDPVQSESSWYETLRAGQRPSRLRVLLIAESPPDPGAGVRRFFYSPELTVDNLYRGVAQALYGERGDVDLADKPAVLERI